MGNFSFFLEGKEANDHKCKGRARAVTARMAGTLVENGSLHIDSNVLMLNERRPDSRSVLDCDEPNLLIFLTTNLGIQHHQHFFQTSS